MPTLKLEQQFVAGCLGPLSRTLGELMSDPFEDEARASGWEPAGGAFAGKVCRLARENEMPDFHFAGQNCVLADSWRAACLFDQKGRTDG